MSETPAPNTLGETIEFSLLKLQAALIPGALKWSRDGLDALRGLLVERDALRAERDALRAERDAVIERLPGIARKLGWLDPFQAGALRAENERLREALTDLRGSGRIHFASCPWPWLSCRCEKARAALRTEERDG